MVVQCVALAGLVVSSVGTVQPNNARPLAKSSQMDNFSVGVASV
jgi:hypothetical protein